MGHKKRFALILLLLLAVSLAAAQDSPRRRTFQGSATIVLGHFDDYFLRIVTGERTINARAGETVDFKMYVRRGDDEKVLHDVRVTDGSEIFEISIEPQIIPAVRNVDMVPLDVELTVPQGTPDGLYPLGIKVAGKEFVEADYPMSTKVKVGSRSWVPGAIFTLCTLATVAVLLWRKYNIVKLTK